MHNYSALVNEADEAISAFQREKYIEILSKVYLDFKNLNCDTWSFQQHTCEGQYKRFIKALTEKIEVSKVNYDEKTAEIVGSEIYHCSLSACDCFDFSSRKLPCKHIYKLLLLLQSTEINTNNAVLPKNQEHRYVVAGEFCNYTCDEIAQMVILLGGTITASVSKKTDYLIAGNNAGKKFERANELGIRILSENEFVAFVKEKGVTI